MTDPELPWQLRRRLAALGAGFAERFEPRELLGEGSFGVVYRAEDRRLARPVVVKVVEYGDSDPVSARRFLEEGRVLAGFDHPHVAGVLDFGAEAGAGYLVYPDLGGRDLAAWLAGRPAPEVEAGRVAPDLVARLLDQVLVGLAYAHGRGVVHRDLKPKNLLMLPDGRLQLIDFGLALREGRTRLTGTRSLVGTAAYVSPQLVRGETACPADDLYAAGVVAYELLTGANPFRAGEVGVTLNRQLGLVPPRLAIARPGCPEGLARLVERLLAKDPAGRPRDAEAARAELQGSGPGVGATATLELPAPAGPLPPPPPVRAKGGPLLAGLLAFGLVMITLLRTGRAPDPRPAPAPAVDPAPAVFDPDRTPAALLAELGGAVAREPGFPPRDPRDWPALGDALPALALVRQELARGGDLSGGDPGRWRALGERFRAAGLPDPGEPWRGIGPSTEPLVLEPKERKSGYLPAGVADRPATGWLATALAERRLLSGEKGVLEAATEAFLAGRGPAPPGEELPEAIRTTVRVAFGGPDKDLMDYLARRLPAHEGRVRREARAWLAGLEARAGRVLRALVQGTREPGPEADRAAIHGMGMLKDIRGYLLPLDAFFGTEALLGGPPRGPAAALVAARWRSERADILGRGLLWRRSPEPAGDRPLWLAAMAGPRRDPWALARVEVALDRIGEPLREGDGPARLAAVAGAVARALLPGGREDLAARLGTFLDSATGGAWGREKGLPPDSLAGLRRELDGVDPGLGERLALPAAP